MKTVIELAREAGLIVDANQSGLDSVAAFAELVCADEREACAYVAEQGFKFSKDGYQIADDIRARGNT